MINLLKLELDGYTSKKINRPFITNMTYKLVHKSPSKPQLKFQIAIDIYEQKLFITSSKLPKKLRGLIVV